MIMVAGASMAVLNLGLKSVGMFQPNIGCKFLVPENVILLPSADLGPKLGVRS